MQVKLDDIGSGERPLRQGSEEEFVDDAGPRDANRALFVASRMSCHDHPAWDALGSHRYLWTVVEAARDLAFRTLLKLIWGKMQTCLDEWMIEHRVLFATRHKGEASEIREPCPAAIWSVWPNQGTPLWDLVCRQVTGDSRAALARF